jgi:hypothetical protein
VKNTKDIINFVEDKNAKIIDIKYKNAKSRFKVKCDKGHEFITFWNNIQQEKWCPACDAQKNRSKAEEEILEFLKPLENTIANYRPKFMNKKEIDIFIPTKSLGIEFHGLYWHSEHATPITEAKSKHIDKFKKCKENGIKLIQIFEDEWKQKSNIVKSMIKSKLGVSEQKISARKCKVKKLKNKDVAFFFKSNHLNENVRCLVSFGLYYKSELVCAISLRKPFTKKHKSSIEIARFASKLNTSVVGGFQKLLKQVKNWSKIEEYSSIITYSDCRFSVGEVYKKAGFEYIMHTIPNYFYVKRGIRENRFKHRKNNNPEFIAKYGNTEREQNNNQDWYAIYDAGNYLWKLSLKS